VFSVFRLCYCAVVSISAINCLERLSSEMTYYVSSETLNPTLTHSLGINPLKGRGVNWLHFVILVYLHF